MDHLKKFLKRKHFVVFKRNLDFQNSSLRQGGHGTGICRENWEINSVKWPAHQAGGRKGTATLEQRLKGESRVDKDICKGEGCFRGGGAERA